MKLTYFSEQTLPKSGPGGGITKLPRVAFSKGGVVNFNKSACALLELQAGDKVTLSQDADQPENWYFHKDKAHGYELRAGYKGNGCMFNHRRLMQTFCEALSKDPDKTHNFKIAGQPTIMKGDKAQTKYWGILII
jgi:hypothetical protein